jgi:hypothetical protein
MYNIANKHNKKTRKLSSSSRNKHKSSSKSKNKRKHKYTIGNTRKRSKSYYTLQGGLGDNVERRIEARKEARKQKAATPPLSRQEAAIKVEQAQERAAQRAKEYRIKNTALTPTAPEEAAAPQDVTRRLPASQREPLRKRKQQNTDLEGELDAFKSSRITENTLLNPSGLHDTATINAAAAIDVNAHAPAAVDSAAVDSAAEAKAAAQAKKATREATKQQEKERLLAESKQMYDKFINKINEYDFDTSEEPSYIKFSKFIQEIMDLQFSIKDDDFRKKAQTITDQILNAYSALVSFYCSNTFLKKHFQTYINKLNIQIQIKDLKQPTVNIDGTVESITPKLQNLASAQDCNHPLSEHLVPDTPTDRSGFAFPSFTIPSFNNPFKRKSYSSDTSNASTSPRASTSRATAELMDMQGNPQREETLNYSTFGDEEGLG